VRKHAENGRLLLRYVPDKHCLELKSYKMYLLEYRDKSVRTEADVVTVLALPVLAMVPSLTTAAERLRARQRRRTLSAGAAAATSVVAGAAVILWVLLR